ncbi:MAG: CRTAC1 family protein, partial [Verrucomicrobia bacterium]
GSGTVDFDNDGRMDLVLNNLAEPAVLLRNTTPDPGHFLTLRLVGGRSNRDGFGAWVEVEAGGRRWQAEARCPTSYLFQSDPRLHFGLGKAGKVDRVIIRWPSGIRQELTEVAADQILTVKEPAGRGQPVEP